MPRISQGFDIGPTSPIRAADPRLAQATSNAAQASGNKSAAPRTADKPVVTAEALSSSEAPVDAERVSMIRRAIEQGTYPVVPARIADAVIAAGLLLRNSDNG